MGGWSAFGTSMAQGGASSIGTSIQSQQMANIAYRRASRTHKSRHQDEIADLRAAGLNPILSVHQPGSIPNVAMATPGQDIGNSALSFAKAEEASSSSKLKKSQTLTEMSKRGLLDSQEKKAATEIFNLEKMFELLDKQLDLTDAQKSEKLKIAETLKEKLGQLKQENEIFSGPAGYWLKVWNILFKRR